MSQAWIGAILAVLIGGVISEARGVQEVPAAGQERPPAVDEVRVADVRVEGLVHFDAPTILGSIQTQKGSAYRRELLAEDIRHLGKTFFEDVGYRVEPGETDSTVVIVFEVVEWLRYRRVRFDGLSAFERREILDRVDIPERGPLSSYTLYRWKREVEDFYRSEGHHYVEVTHRLEGERSSAGQGVEVVLYVVEGPEVTIEDIVFEGNSSIPSDDLLDVMDLEVETFFTSGLFVEETLEEDLVALRQYYRGQGFAESRLALYSTEFSPSRAEVRLRFVVEEGPRYFIQGIEFRGNRAFEEVEFQGLLKTKVGDPWVRREIAEDAARISKRYREGAYIDAEIRFDEPIFAEHGNLVTLVFDIFEGKKHYVRDIDIRGNRVTRDDVIRREISLAPGDPFNLEEVSRSYNRLYGLQYFNSSQGVPFINPYPFPAPPEWVPPELPDEDEDVEVQWDDLVIEVEEGQVSQFRFVVGIGSDNGLIGGVELVRRNFDLGNLPSSFGSTLSETIDGMAFTGGGQTLTMAVTPGTELTTYRLGFLEPYLFGSNFSLDVDISQTLRRFRRYDLERTSLDLGFGRRITREFSVGMGFRNDRVNVDDIDFLLLTPIDTINMDPNRDFLFNESVLPEPVYAARGHTSVRALRLYASYNTVDNPFLPTEGLSVGGTYEWAPNFLGTRIANFSRANVNGEWFGPIYEAIDRRRIVLGLRGGLGWAEALGNDDRVPFFEQFFAGGRSSLRSFAFQGVGPRQYDQAVGGNALILGGAEISFPLLGDFDARLGRYEEYVRGVIFADTGTLATDLHDKELGRFRLGLGAGLRIKIPFLGPVPFALDFGVPVAWWDDRYELDKFGRLVRIEGDKRQVFSFSFGRRF